MSVSQQFVQESARQLQNFAFDEKRSAELALELSRLNSAIVEISARLDFTDEPAAFRALLERRSK
jgi:hypothetical protein